MSKQVIEHLSGRAVTLAASGVRTISASGDGVSVPSHYRRWIVLLSVTNADTDGGDLLDVYVDVSIDGGTKWLNAVHFGQVLGTDSATYEYAVLDPTTPGTSTIAVTSDAAVDTVRPTLFGPTMRARWVVVDTGSDDATFTFAVTAYGQP